MAFSFIEKYILGEKGRSKSKGRTDDDVKGISKQKKLNPTSKKPKKKATSNQGVSQGSTTSRTPLKKKTKPIVKKDNKTTKSKSKVKATAGNTKGFASTMAMQKKLKKMGANIKVDGIMGPKTRAAMAKFIKAPEPKSRPTTKKNVSQGSTIAKDRGKTGFGTSAMSTKGSTKPAEKRYKKSGVTKLTEFQKKLALRDNRRKVIGST